MYTSLTWRVWREGASYRLAWPNSVATPQVWEPNRKVQAARPGTPQRRANSRVDSLLVSRFSTEVEGFILASSRLSDERIRSHTARRPLVLINRDVKGIPRVLMDSGVGVS